MTLLNHPEVVAAFLKCAILTEYTLKVLWGMLSLCLTPHARTILTGIILQYPQKFHFTSTVISNKCGGQSVHYTKHARTSNKYSILYYFY